MGLIDALIALAILSFGLLAMTRFQTRMVAQTTEAQERLTAVQLGDQILSTAIVDAANRSCYTLPASGAACGSPAALLRVAEWANAASTAMPNLLTSTVALNADRLTMTLTWTGKESQEVRTQQATTDVRP